ncbi:MAG: nucleotidyltransferase domain-containing protein [Planctomycetota bacterium]
MHPVIESNRDALTELCRRYHVLTLEVFGSAATGDYRPGKSDIDLLAEFDHDAPIPALDQYLGFRGDAEALLGGPIDLVHPSELRNPYFRHEVNETRKPLYAAQAPAHAKRM